VIFFQILYFTVLWTCPRNTSQWGVLATFETRLFCGHMIRKHNRKAIRWVTKKWDHHRWFLWTRYSRWFNPTKVDLVSYLFERFIVTKLVLALSIKTYGICYNNKPTLTWLYNNDIIPVKDSFSQTKEDWEDSVYFRVNQPGRYLGM